MESNIPHEVEARLRNIEAHLGIGKTDEETGEYTVTQADESPAEEETPEETEPETEPEETEPGVV